MGPLFENILCPGLIVSEPLLEMVAPQISELSFQKVLEELFFYCLGESTPNICLLTWLIHTYPLMK